MASVCRLCLSSTSSPYKAIAAIEEKHFQLVLPEIDIHLVQSPMFCSSCIDLLQTSYSFKSNCIKTEKMIKSYASNCGGGNLLLNDVLQNHFLETNHIQSGDNDAPALLNKDIKVEGDNDSFDCDLDLAGEDSPEIDIKLDENKISFEVSQQVDTTTCKETSDDESNTKFDSIIDCKKPFRCEECGNSFCRRSLLIHHLKRHYEHPHCFTCSRELSNRTALKRHLLKFHNIDMSEEHEEQLYIINIDNDKLDDSIQKHLELYKSVVDLKGVKNSDDGEPFKCNICKKGYHKKKFFLEHIRIHFTKSDCGLCGKRFNTMAMLKRHLPTAHQIDMGDNTTWRNHITVVVDIPEMEKAMKEHSKLEEMDDKNESEVVENISITSEYTCESCGKQFRAKASLNRHKLIMHGNKTTICDYCQKGFLTKATLEMHISACHPDICSKRTLDRNFTCDTCGFTTIYKHRLIEHIRTHTGEKPYKCDLCDKAYAQGSSLIWHKRTVHSTERLFTCEYCSKSFNVYGSLNKHILEVHLVDKIEKKFVCSFCGKKYRLQSQLKTHVKWHMSDKQFSCDICGKEFVDRHSVKKHRVTHFAEKKHKCEICGKGFHQKSNIKIHMKVHSRVS